MIVDRKTPPKTHAISKPQFIDAEREKLDNGIPVYTIVAGSQEVCKIDFVFDAGLWFQNRPLQSVIANTMLQEGSKNFNAQQIAEAFDFHGAYLQLSADYHHATVSIIALEKHLANLLPIVEDLIKHSIFPENEFENLIRRRKQRFLMDVEKVKIQCQKKFSEALFGSEHPYCLNLKAEDFDAVSRNEFYQFYQEHYNSSNCEIFISGHFKAASSQVLNKHFGADDWAGRKPKLEQKPIQSASDKSIHIVKEDSIQSAIRMGKLAIDKSHDDYFGLQILTTILGGYFSSRLMLNIREDKGFTYGIGANLISLEEASYLLIATEVDKSYEEATTTEIYRELEKLRNEAVPEDELERVKQYLTGEFLREFDGPFSLGQSFRNIHDFGLDYSYYDRYLETLKSITPPQLKSLAEKYLQADSLFKVVVGQA